MTHRQSEEELLYGEVRIVHSRLSPEALALFDEYWPGKPEPGQRLAFEVGGFAVVCGFELPAASIPTDENIRAEVDARLGRIAAKRIR